MKLDYNYYYSQREVENFHKKQRESDYYDKNADDVEGEHGEEEYAEGEENVGQENDYNDDNEENEDNHEYNEDHEENADEINNDLEKSEIKFNSHENSNPYLNPRKSSKMDSLSKRQEGTNEEERINIGSNSNEYADSKHSGSLMDEAHDRSYNVNVSGSRRVNFNDFIHDKSNLDKNYPSDENNSFTNYSYTKNKKK